MKRMIKGFIFLIAAVFIAGCAMAPQNNSQYGTPQAGYPAQGSTPPRGGYDQQMNQEQGQRNQEAAGALLPELLKMRDLMAQ